MLVSHDSQSQKDIIQEELSMSLMNVVIKIIGKIVAMYLKILNS